MIFCEIKIDKPRKVYIIILPSGGGKETLSGGFFKSKKRTKKGLNRKKCVAKISNNQHKRAVI